MMLLPCPWCGPRNATEFRYVGESGPRPDPNTATSAEWRRYLYMQRNPLGWVREGWYHRAGCRQFFTVDRDTGTNLTRTVGAET